MRKLKKQNKKKSILKTEKKTNQVKLEEEKRNIREIITIKNVLNQLINIVKELENVTFNK